MTGFTCWAVRSETSFPQGEIGAKQMMVHHRYIRRWGGAARLRQKTCVKPRTLRSQRLLAVEVTLGQIEMLLALRRSWDAAAGAPSPTANTSGQSKNVRWGGQPPFLLGGLQAVQEKIVAATL